MPPAQGWAPYLDALYLLNKFLFLSSQACTLPKKMEYLFMDYQIQGH